MDSPKTSLPLDDAAFVADVRKVLEFLVKDTTYATEVTNKELDLIKAHVDTVNSFIVVATFIAAVQGQIIALTFGVNDTSLQIFTNGIGLIGLTFDILGACFGMLVAVILQGHIRRSNTWLKSSTMENLVNLVNGKGDGDLNRREIETKLEKYIRKRRIFWRQRSNSKILPGDQDFMAHRKQMLCLTKPKELGTSTKGSGTHGGLGTSTILKHIPGPQRITIIANIPPVTMGFGIVSLFVSVICFAASTQRPHVWLACVIVSMTTIACSLICLAYMKLSDLLLWYALRQVKSSTSNNQNPEKLKGLVEQLKSSQSY